MNDSKRSHKFGIGILLTVFIALVAIGFGGVMFCPKLGIPLAPVKFTGGILLPAVMALLGVATKARDENGTLTVFGRAQVILLAIVAGINLGSSYVEDVQKRDAASQLLNKLGGLAEGLNTNLSVSKTNLDKATESLDRSVAIETTSNTILGSVKNVLSLTTGGSTKPILRVLLPTYVRNDGSVDANATPYPKLLLDVIGRKPLKNLNIMVTHVECHDLNHPTLEGHAVYEKYFESFLSTGLDRRAVADLTLQGNRDMFWAMIGALNGSWEEVIKFRRSADQWEWRYVLYTRTHDGGITILSDRFSKAFPIAERQRPILPLTTDDCEGPRDPITSK